MTSGAIKTVNSPAESFKAPLGLLVPIIAIPAITTCAGAINQPDHPILVAAVPIALVYTILSTLGLCYSLMAKANKIRKGVYFPAISELGVQRPEQLLYQVGMSLVACCLAVGMFGMEGALLRHFTFGHNATYVAEATQTLVGSRKAGLMAAVGVCTQGLFTLELTISFQSILHWAGTAVFAYGAFQHCEAMLRLFDGIESPLAEHPWFIWSNAAKHLCIEKVPSLLFFLPILGQVLSASGIGGNTEPEPKEKSKESKEPKQEQPDQVVLANLPEKGKARMAAYEVCCRILSVRVHALVNQRRC